MTCIKKDTNVLLLIKAFTSVAVISKGLREKFKNYGSLTFGEILGRFKEKKISVVTAGRMAADTVASTIKFPDQVMEILGEKLSDKNPSIRSETTLTIMRNVKPKSVVLGKSVLKELMPKLIANLDHSDKESGWLDNQRKKVEKNTTVTNNCRLLAISPYLTLNHQNGK